MTNFVRQKFQWFFDMATSTSSLEHIQISAGGPEVVTRLEPFFGAFKYFKLGKVKLKFVPAATLPVDPTGLSIEAGANNSDPRDLFNPGLVRITNGEDIVQIPKSMAQYYAMVLDRRWYKFNLQRGFSRSAYPRYWGVGQMQQDIFPGSQINLLNRAQLAGNSISLKANNSQPQYFEQNASCIYGPHSSGRGLFQTGQKIRMDWLPTDYFQQNMTTASEGGAGLTTMNGVNTPPYFPLIDIILPQAFLTKHYYRVYVEEEVMFKDAVAINPIEYPGESSVPIYMYGVDRFTYAQLHKVDNVASNYGGEGQSFVDDERLDVRFNLTGNVANDGTTAAGLGPAGNYGEDLDE